MPHTAHAHIRAHPTRRAQHGAMLLEVLVSILIFSFGVLALVGLQGNMTRAQTEAELRAEASFLANEALGLMWSDVNNLGSYDAATCNTLDACVTWQQKVVARLPNGQGRINVLPAAGGQGRMAEVVITWTPSNSTQRTHRATSQITPAG